jgi:uncharacterized integral membrane protein
MDAFPATPASDNDRELRRIAKRRVDIKMGFYVHLLVYVCVNVGLFTLNYLGGGYRWSLFPALGWGLGLAIHGIVVAVQLMGGADLRERMMQQEIERLKQRR